MKFFSFKDPSGVNTPEPQPNSGTCDTASSEKTNRMDDDAFDAHPKHLLYSRGTLDPETKAGGLSEIVTSSRRETPSNTTDAVTESSWNSVFLGSNDIDAMLTF